MEDLDPTTLADYLAIAAKLLVIKSKAILPSLEIEPEEEEAGVDLESKLILNKQFKEASKLLKLFDKGITGPPDYLMKINFYPTFRFRKRAHGAILHICDLRNLNLPKAK